MFLDPDPEKFLFDSTEPLITLNSRGNKIKMDDPSQVKAAEVKNTIEAKRVAAEGKDLDEEIKRYDG